MVRVLLDVDGVIADFTGAYLTAVEKALGRTYTPADVRDWDIGDALGLSTEDRDLVHEVLDQPGVGQGLKPLPGAVAGVKEVMKLAEVYFVTSPLASSPTWIYDRAIWIEKHFGKEYRDNIISAKKKAPIFGNLFVDDKPQNVDEWSKAWPMCNALLWDIPANRSAKGTYLRVGDWQTVKRMVQLVSGMAATKLPNGLKAAV
jgi:5'(3')-deoxyribonucleotidase